MRGGWVGVLILLAGCQAVEAPVFEVERTRSFQRSKDQVWASVQGFLGRSQIEIRSADPASGTIQAARQQYQDQGWAHCADVWVRDGSTNSRRPTRARPIDRDLKLTVQVDATGATTTVQLDARFSQQMMNPHRNLPFQANCQSTGTLEAALLNAIGAPAAPPDSGATGSAPAVPGSPIDPAPAGGG
jgi:hypothetical protein